MKRRKTLLLFAAMVLCSFMVACGGMDSDAKKAAKLTNTSIQQATALNFKESEKSFKEAQKIISRYSEHKKWAEFYELYKKYRDEDKTNTEP